MITNQHAPNTSISVSLAILSAILLCGVVAGCITASYIGGDSGKTLSDYMTRYVTSIGSEAGAISLLPGTAWNIYKYPIFAFVFGFTVLGIVLIPATVALRGFFLAFSIGTMIRLFGYQGMVLALAIFGIQTLIGIPCLLVISAQGFAAARSFARMMSGGKRVVIGSVFPKGYFLIFGVCMAALFAVTLLEVFVTPKIVALVAVSLIN